MGHYRRDCVTKYCHHHGVYGHSSEECSRPTSYAGALKGQDNAEPEAVEETEVEEQVRGVKAAKENAKVSGTDKDIAAGRKGVAEENVVDNPTDDTVEYLFLIILYPISRCCIWP